LTVGEALAQGTALFIASGVETAALDASLLLGEVLKTDRVGLVLRSADPLPEGGFARYAESLKRRAAGECAAYILGRKEFRGLDFGVSADVLVPRPDTETLVEAALKHLDARRNTPPLPSPPSVLDLCTGSGAVAIALQYERPGTVLYASDISEAALKIALSNAARLLPYISPVPPAESGQKTEPEHRPVTFIQSDLFAEIPLRFDLITANPPYIPSGMIGALSPEVQGEPRIALDGGADGLALIRRIITEGKDHLRSGGGLLLEADPRQMDTIAGLLASEGYNDIEVYMDLAGRRRVIGGTISA
jgi:release factor glutamine methyltransferase